MSDGIGSSLRSFVKRYAPIVITFLIFCGIALIFVIVPLLFVKVTPRTRKIVELTTIEEALQHGGALVRPLDKDGDEELPRRQSAVFICFPGDYRELGRWELALMDSWKSAVIVGKHKPQKLANGKVYEVILISRYPQIP